MTAHTVQRGVVLVGTAVAFKVAEGLPVSQQGIVDDVERPRDPPEAGERGAEALEREVALYVQRDPATETACSRAQPSTGNALPRVTRLRLLPMYRSISVRVSRGNPASRVVSPGLESIPGRHPGQCRGQCRRLCRRPGETLAPLHLSPKRRHRRHCGPVVLGHCRPQHAKC